jgi:hypothetical protein
MAISFCSWDAACETSVDRLQKLETEEFHKGSLACPEYSGLTLKIRSGERHAKWEFALGPVFCILMLASIISSIDAHVGQKCVTARESH